MARCLGLCSIILCLGLSLCTGKKSKILNRLVSGGKDFERVHENNSDKIEQKPKLTLQPKPIPRDTKPGASHDQLDSIKAPQISLNPVDMAIAGGVASAFGDFIMHPLDTIKTTQQASKTLLSITEACNNIYKHHGFGGFYSGVHPYMIGDGLAGAIKFATYEVSKGYFHSRIPEKWIPYSNFVCGAGAMLACSVVLVPGELLKQKLQSGMATSLLGGIKSIFAAEGIAGFYQGYGATMLRDIPYTMLELGLYDVFKILFMNLRIENKSSQTNELFAAGLSGAVTGFVTTPLDVIKTRIMTTKIGEAAPGLFTVVSDIVKAEGASGLFKGAVVRVSWLVPLTMIYLPFYETTKRALMKLKVYKHNKMQSIVKEQ